MKIMEERRGVYTNWLVKWPPHEQSVIDLSTRQSQGPWLAEEEGDTEMG